MRWEVIAAIAASATFILSLVLFVIVPVIQRHTRSKLLSRIIELKDNAIGMQNDNNRTLTEEELDKFKSCVARIISHP